MTKTKTEMKRIAVILFLLFAFFSLSACEPGNESSYNPVEQPGTSGESSGDNSDQTEGNAPGDTSGESTEEEPDVERPDEPNVPSQGVQGRYLVVYCSRSGNTEQVAEQIRTTLRCDIWRWNLLHPMSRTTKRCLPGLRRRLPRFVPAVIHR